MKQYQHLFFDLDHTLWDFETNSKTTLQYLYQEYDLRRRGIDDFEVFRTKYEYHNEILWTKLRAGIVSREELRYRRMELILDEYGICDATLAQAMSSLYLEILPKQTALLDGAQELLEYCSNKNYQLHIITNGFETTQWEKLRTAQLANYFKHIFTSENAKSMKPHKPIFQYALKVTGADVHRSLMIGDSLEADIQGAKGVGIDQVFYNPAGMSHNEVVTYEVRHLIEVMRIL